MTTVKRVRQVIENMADDTPIAVLFYDKSMFKNIAELSDEQWALIVGEFDEWDTIDEIATEWLIDAVMEHGVTDMDLEILAESEDVDDSEE